MRKFVQVTARFRGSVVRHLKGMKTARQVVEHLLIRASTSIVRLRRNASRE